jgi:hypothetical protein
VFISVNSLCWELLVVCQQISYVSLMVYSINLTKSSKLQTLNFLIFHPILIHYFFSLLPKAMWAFAIMWHLSSVRPKLWTFLFFIKFKCLVFYAPATNSRGGHINLPPVRPDIDTWFFRRSPFGATALIFVMMFIHIMEVCMSTGFWFSSNILKMTGSWT